MYVDYISWSVATIEHQLQFAINHLSHWLCRMDFPSLHQRPSVFTSHSCGVYILPLIYSVMTVLCPCFSFLVSTVLPCQQTYMGTSSEMALH
jgi:hypothetical protein